MTRVLLLAIIATFAVPAAAQEALPLFVHRSAAAAGAVQAPRGGRAAIVSRARVGLEIDRLFAPTGVAARVLLNTPGDSWTARFERLDVDAAGFRSWVGAIEGIADSHVVFTERHGIVSGLINAVGTTYQVRTETPGTYLLELVDLTSLAAEHDPIAVVNPAHAGLAAAAAYDDAGTIDVLVLYTPRARDASGGTAQIHSLVSQIISDTNTAFARSGVSPRVRLSAAVEFSQNEAWSMSSDLNTLSSSPEAQLLREAARADLVQLLVSSPDMSTCGIGYLLTQNSPDFSAYSVADVACAAQYTPTHEMGHNMGSHHAPEDGAAGALFPYSYGFKDPVREFRTVMAYGCAGVTCGRILNFSNPAVSYRDGPTGTSVQDNARSIEAAAFAVANFKQSAASTPSDLPPPPAGLHSSVTGNAVTVWWDDVPSGDPAFVLQVGTAAGAADILSKSVYRTRSASGTLSAGTYYWRVFSLTDAGPGAPSSEGRFTVSDSCSVPSAPRDLTFAVVNDHVTLAWGPPVTGQAPVSYIIEVGSAPGLADLLVAAAGPVTMVGTPAPPGIYFVRVRAQNACGTSLPSNEQAITVP